MSTYENAESVKILLSRDEASELVNYILDELADGKDEVVLAFGEGIENNNNG